MAAAVAGTGTVMPLVRVSQFWLSWAIEAARKRPNKPSKPTLNETTSARLDRIVS
jgi:hypothetical protein